MTVEELWHELGRPQPPSCIVQKPFDYDPAHYARLLRSRAEGTPPDSLALVDYALDLSYEEVQTDLFVYLLPLCLDVWSAWLRGSGGEAGFVEQFWFALNKRPGPLALLSEARHAAVDRFIREGILAAIDAGRRLCVEGAERTLSYRRLRELGSYATLFGGLRELWTPWWRLESEGRAAAALQYLSCLMYENAANPVFGPRSARRGGGPPELWGDSISINDRPWDPRNVAFLRAELHPDRLHAAAAAARERLSDSGDRRTAAQMIEDFPACRTLVELRITQLLEIVAANHSRIFQWTL